MRTFLRWPAALASLVALAVAACGGDEAPIVRSKSGKGGDGGAGGNGAGARAGAAGSSAGAGGSLSGAGAAGSSAGAGGSTGGVGGSAGGVGGSAAGMGGASAGIGGSTGGVGGSAAGVGGSNGGAAGTSTGGSGAGGGCSLGPNVPIVEPTKKATSSECSVTDDLADWVQHHEVESIALGVDGASTVLYLVVEKGSFDRELRRYTVKRDAGCSLERDTAFVAPTAIACRAVFPSSDGTVWCAGSNGAPAGGPAIARVYPTASPLCLGPQSAGAMAVAIDPVSRTVMSQIPGNNSLPLQRFTYDDTSCTLGAAPTACLPGSTSTPYDLAYDGQKQLHVGSLINVAVIDEAGLGKNVRFYGTKILETPQGLAPCSTGVCSFTWNAKDVFVFGVDAQGSVAVKGQPNAPAPGDGHSLAFTSTKTVGLIIDKQSQGGIDGEDKTSAWLIEGL